MRTFSRFYQIYQIFSFLVALRCSKLNLPFGSFCATQITVKLNLQSEEQRQSPLDKSKINTYTKIWTPSFGRRNAKRWRRIVYRHDFVFIATEKKYQETLVAAHTLALSVDIVPHRRRSLSHLFKFKQAIYWKYYVKQVFLGFSLALL